MCNCIKAYKINNFSLVYLKSSHTVLLKVDIMSWYIISSMAIHLLNNNTIFSSVMVLIEWMYKPFNVNLEISSNFVLITVLNQTGSYQLLKLVCMRFLFDIGTMIASSEIIIVYLLDGFLKKKNIHSFEEY